GVLAERIIGQADRAQELEVLGQYRAGLVVGGVEEAVRHHHGHHAARAQVHPRLGDDVVVNLHAVEVAAVLVPVGDAHRTKRRVADGQIKHAVGELGVLEAGAGQHVGIGVQQLGHAAGGGVQLGGVPFGGSGQVCRLQSDEVADTH